MIARLVSLIRSRRTIRWIGNTFVPIFLATLAGYWAALHSDHLKEERSRIETTQRCIAWADYTLQWDLYVLKANLDRLNDISKKWTEESIDPLGLNPVQTDGIDFLLRTVGKDMFDSHQDFRTMLDADERLTFVGDLGRKYESTRISLIGNKTYYRPVTMKLANSLLEYTNNATQFVDSAIALLREKYKPRYHLEAEKPSMPGRP